MDQSATTVTTATFRVSYPNLFTARKNNLSGKDEFSVLALFGKGADIANLKAAANAAVIAEWGADATKWPTKNIDDGQGGIKVISALKNPFRRHEEKMKDGKLPDGMEAGGVFLTFKCYNRPGIVDQAMQAILEPSKIYAGCYGRASVNASTYSEKGNMGVSFWLNHFQLVKDGEPISGRPNVESAFTPIMDSQGATVGGSTGRSASDLF